MATLLIRDKVLTLIANELVFQGQQQEAVPLWLFLILNNGEGAGNAFISMKRQLANDALQSQAVSTALKNGDAALNEYLQKNLVYLGAFSNTQQKKITEGFSSATTLSEFQNLIFE